MAGTVTYEWLPNPVVVADEYDRMYFKFMQRHAVMHAALEVVLNNTEQHFDEEGPGWAPWAEATAADPRHGPLVLTRSGALRSAATSEGSYETTNDFILWTGADAPAYWRFHWTGTSKMPERNFIGLDAAGEEEVMGVFETWLGSLGL